MAGKPFTILAINMAEDEATIRRFLQEKVKVDFPILLDRDQAVLKRWKVFVFPTSYLLGADGKIAYGLAGAIEWDEPGHRDDREAYCQPEPRTEDRNTRTEC